MNIIDTIILGIVEGITEFLPISSTAHLVITQNLLQIPTTEFIKSFEIVIQLGAILAVVVLFYKKVFSSFKYFLNICIAFIPTGIIGFVLYKIIKSFLLGNLLLIGVMLLLGGIVILIFEKFNKDKQKEKGTNNDTKTIESLSFRELITLGSIQALAVIPGVSRSGAVIIGGRMLGLNASLITEFSFLLAIPTMLAATLYDLLKSGFSFGGGEWQTIGLGFIVSFIVALLVVKWLINYIKNHSFVIFGWYRIAIGLVIIGLVLI